MDTASLPSRERGLKYVNVNFMKATRWSLPSRERGLKSKDGEMDKALDKSLPSRERGLKLLWVLAKVGVI